MGKLPRSDLKRYQFDDVSGDVANVDVDLAALDAGLVRDEIVAFEVEFVDFGAEPDLIVAV